MEKLLNSTMFFVGGILIRLIDYSRNTSKGISEDSGLAHLKEQRVALVEPPSLQVSSKLFVISCLFLPPWGADYETQILVYLHPCYSARRYSTTPQSSLKLLQHYH